MMNHIAASEKIGDWLDGDLSPDEEIAVAEHLETCRACQDELGEISELRDRARALPSEIPPARDLWPEIAARIDDHKVIALGQRQPSRAPMSRKALAAAAIVLVAMSSALTAWLVGDRPVQQYAETPASAAPSGPTALAAFQPTEQEYLSTVADLRATLDSRRDVLAPETIAVVERNLRIIDAAIEDSRAALEADPSNTTLPLTLSDMYRRKVELLTTALQLPAQT